MDNIALNIEESRQIAREPLYTAVTRADVRLLSMANSLGQLLYLDTQEIMSLRIWNSLSDLKT